MYHDSSATASEHGTPTRALPAQGPSTNVTFSQPSICSAAVTSNIFTAQSLQSSTTKSLPSTEPGLRTTSPAVCLDTRNAFRKPHAAWNSLKSTQPWPDTSASLTKRSHSSRP